MAEVTGIASALTLFWRPLAAAVFGGAACGVVGVWIVLMNIGVTMSHAAFAGAVAGLLLGINPLISSFIFCVTASLLIGPVTESADLEPGVSLGIIFSVMLGLAFLGIGLLKGPRTEALRLIWGNILLVTRTQVLVLVLTLTVILSFLALFWKETKAVLFNREIARAVGIPERPVFLALLLFAGAAIAANLDTIGGLLIFSLIVNPPSAAYQLTWRLSTMYLLSTVFAIGSCLVGLGISWLFDVPAGAVIIIISSLIFAVSLLLSPKRRRLPVEDLEPRALSDNQRID